ncbi:winged helix-turn-helix transcriptional regulator [Glycomyces xiaoerkulensis]|uniref:winged helix-turn-helix transcriptional regulator n=1 Tax=Glycomyces xiaoerkulensis TaxID=2038139 RepID=UPI000C25CA46|nr:winged helix-turn-helix transcriptional regulator [Glycomyces xiaoerkulensis]
MRTYGDGCPAAHALDLIGERWSLLIVRELILGPKRFTDLRAGLHGASANVISQRLRELETHGVVTKRRLPPPAASKVYELSEWGRELEAIIVPLIRWGARSAAIPLDAPTGTDALILAMRGLFTPVAAQDFDAAFELWIGDRPFVAEILDTQLLLAPGRPEHPHAVIRTDPETLKRLTLGGRSLDVSLHAGRITVQGDQAMAERFLGMFRLPEPASASRLEAEV